MMADVVAVHGILANRSSRDEMHDSWLAALREGLRNARFPRVEDLTLGCAFYGYLYNDGKGGPWLADVLDSQSAGSVGSASEAS